MALLKNRLLRLRAASTGMQIANRPSPSLITPDQVPDQVYQVYQVLNHLVYTIHAPLMHLQFLDQ